MFRRAIISLTPHYTLATVKETMMSEIEMTPAYQTAANWQKEELLVFVPTEPGCRYEAIIYPAGSVWSIGAVLFLEGVVVHCQAAGPESMETGPAKHTIRTIDPENGKHYLLERTGDIVKYRPLTEGKPQRYKLSPQSISKIAWSNGIIIEVALA